MHASEITLGVVSLRSAYHITVNYLQFMHVSAQPGFAKVHLKIDNNYQCCDSIGGCVIALDL